MLSNRGKYMEPTRGFRISSVHATWILTWRSPGWRTHSSRKTSMGLMQTGLIIGLSKFILLRPYHHEAQPMPRLTKTLTQVNTLENLANRLWAMAFSLSSQPGRALALCIMMWWPRVCRANRPQQRTVTKLLLKRGKDTYWRQERTIRLYHSPLNNCYRAGRNSQRATGEGLFHSLKLWIIR